MSIFEININPLVPKKHTFFGDNLKKQHPLTKMLVLLPLLSNNQNKKKPTPNYTQHITREHIVALKF